MQHALLGTYSNGIVKLDEHIEKENGNRVVVVFLTEIEKKDSFLRSNSVDEMYGIFAGEVSGSVSDDFARNKLKEIEREI